PGEFDLLRVAGSLECIQKPIVKRAMDLEFQSADRMRNSFDHVGKRMREVIHGINAPFIPGAVMIDLAYAIKNGIAQMNVGRRHVDFGTEDARAIGEFTTAHAREKIEVFLHGTNPIGAFLSWNRRRAAILLDFLER